MFRSSLAASAARQAPFQRRTEQLPVALAHPGNTRPNLVRPGAWNVRRVAIAPMREQAAHQSTVLAAQAGTMKKEDRPHRLRARHVKRARQAQSQEQPCQESASCELRLIRTPGATHSSLDVTCEHCAHPTPLERAWQVSCWGGQRWGWPFELHPL